VRRDRAPRTNRKTGRAARSAPTWTAATSRGRSDPAALWELCVCRDAFRPCRRPVALHAALLQSASPVRGTAAMPGIVGAARAPRPRPPDEPQDRSRCTQGSYMDCCHIAGPRRSRGIVGAARAPRPRLPATPQDQSRCTQRSYRRCRRASGRAPVGRRGHAVNTACAAVPNRRAARRSPPMRPARRSTAAATGRRGWAPRVPVRRSGRSAGPAPSP